MSNRITPVVVWSNSVDNSMSANKVQIKNEEEQRLQAHAERSSSFLYLLTEWAENISWGGVPYIVKKSNYFFKAMWLALVLAGLGLTGYQVWQVVDRFYKYPVNININITYASKLTFPAVTICNVNVLRLSSVNVIPPQYIGLFSTLLGNIKMSVASEERLKKIELFQQIYSSMDYSTRIAISHRKTDMILDCVYNGKTCTMDDWIEWNSAVLGNCFTFNFGYKVNATTVGWYPVPYLETYRTGPDYGLSVELYIQEEEYVKELTDTAGVKVIVHDQGTAPFPGDEGIYLQPATYSSITLQKANISHQPYPYPSNCIMISNVEDAMKLDANVEIFNTNYDFGGCLKSCYQAYVIRDCGCGDPKLPINTIATRYFAANKTATYGPCNDLVTLQCQYNMSQLFAENLLNCDQCRVACSSIVYTHSLSTARWPNKAFMKAKLDQIASINSDFANHMVNATSPQDNILKFNLHFEELNYEVIYESPTYTSDSFYCDIGGVIGLWLGLTFIAVFELIQLVMDSLVLCITMLTTKKKEED